MEKLEGTEEQIKLANEIRKEITTLLPEYLNNAKLTQEQKDNILNKWNKLLETETRSTFYFNLASTLYAIRANSISPTIKKWAGLTKIKPAKEYKQTMHLKTGRIIKNPKGL